MQRGTIAYAAGFALTLACLVASIRGVSHQRAAQGRKEFVLACWGGEKETKELQSLVVAPINSENGGFSIKLVPIPSDYYTKLCTMIAGGTAPDFFYLSQEYIPAFASQGALLDLTDLVERDADEVTDLDSYYPSVLDLYRHKGRIYGLPWIAQPVILYCNAKLFREAGVPLPDAGWDWDRFVEAAKALTTDKDGDGRIDQWGFILNGWPPYQMWVWQNGANAVLPGAGGLNLDDPLVTEAIDFYSGLIHTHRVAPPLSVVSEAGFSEQFRAGKVAMFMGGAADDLDRVEGLEVVTAELPKGPMGIRATWAWTAGLHISPGVRDRQLAFKAWKRVLNGIQRWKIPAPRKSLAARLERFDPRKAAAASVIKASMEYMRAPVILERQIEWDAVFWEEFEEEILREGTPAREMVQRARTVLEGFF